MCLRAYLKGLDTLIDGSVNLCGLTLCDTLSSAWQFLDDGFSEIIGSSLLSSELILGLPPCLYLTIIDFLEIRLEIVVSVLETSALAALETEPASTIESLAEDPLMELAADLIASSTAVDSP